MNTTEHCSGCRDDVYNHANYGMNMVDGKPRCWCLANATLVMRKEVHVDQVPPWNQKPIKVLSCFRRPRHVYLCCPGQDELT